MTVITTLGRQVGLSFATTARKTLSLADLPRSTASAAPWPNSTRAASKIWAFRAATPRPNPAARSGTCPPLGAAKSQTGKSRYNFALFSDYAT